MLRHLVELYRPDLQLVEIYIALLTSVKVGQFMTAMVLALYKFHTKTC